MAVCSGQIAQNGRAASEADHGEAPVPHGDRAVRRTVRRTVILSFLVILTILLVASEPLTAWWIGRSTATSWPLWWSPLTTPPEVSPARISLTLPHDRRIKAQEDLLLTVGIGCTSCADTEATLELHAPGYDITDRSGTTVSDRYTRRITDLDSGRYGMVSTQNRLERVWNMDRPLLCGYTEEFTLRWRGKSPEAADGTAPGKADGRDDITATLRTSNGFGAVTVYDIDKGGDRIRLSTKPPSRGCSSSNATLSPTATADVTAGTAHGE